jgi:hypothetical protein
MCWQYQTWKANATFLENESTECFRSYGFPILFCRNSSKLVSILEARATVHQDLHARYSKAIYVMQLHSGYCQNITICNYVAVLNHDSTAKILLLLQIYRVGLVSKESELASQFYAIVAKTPVRALL